MFRTMKCLTCCPLDTPQRRYARYAIKVVKIVSIMLLVLNSATQNASVYLSSNPYIRRPVLLVVRLTRHTTARMSLQRSTHSLLVFAETWKSLLEKNEPRVAFHRDVRWIQYWNMSL